MPKLFKCLQKLIHGNSSKKNRPLLDADSLIRLLKEEIVLTVATGEDLRDILAYIDASAYELNREIPCAASFIPTKVPHPNSNMSFGSVHEVLEMINELRLSKEQEENIPSCLGNSR